MAPDGRVDPGVVAPPISGASDAQSTDDQTLREHPSSTTCFPRRRCGRRCCLIVKVIVTVIVVVSIGFIVVVLLILPVQQPTFEVQSVNITGLDAKASTTELNTTVLIKLIVRNRTKRLGLCYDDMYLDVQAPLGNSTTQSLGNGTSPGFYQDHNNTTDIYAVTRYKGLVTEDRIRALTTAFRGNFSLEVKVDTEVRIKMGFITSGRFKIRVHCDLVVDLRRFDPPKPGDCKLIGHSPWW